MDVDAEKQATFNAGSRYRELERVSEGAGATRSGVNKQAEHHSNSAAGATTQTRQRRRFLATRIKDDY
jgi:hypothetical protein